MGFRARLWAMDALVAAPPPADGTKSVKVRRKKKTARVAPVGAGEGGSALTMDAAAAQPVSPADVIKKKRLKLGARTMAAACSVCLAGTRTRTRKGGRGMDRRLGLGTERQQGLSMQ